MDNLAAEAHAYMLRLNGMDPFRLEGQALLQTLQNSLETLARDVTTDKSDIGDAPATAKTDGTTQMDLVYCRLHPTENVDLYGFTFLDAMPEGEMCVFCTDEEPPLESRFVRADHPNATQYVQLSKRSSDGHPLPICTHVHHTVCFLKYFEKGGFFRCPTCRQQPSLKYVKLSRQMRTRMADVNAVTKINDDGTSVTIESVGKRKFPYRILDKNGYMVEMGIEKEDGHGVLYQFRTDNPTAELVQTETPIVNGIPEGTELTYDQFSRVVEERELKGGLDHGERRYYAYNDKDGTDFTSTSKKCIGHEFHEHGLPSGKWEVRTFDGDLTRLCIYQRTKRGIEFKRITLSPDVKLPKRLKIERGVRSTEIDEEETLILTIESEANHIPKTLKPAYPLTETKLINETHYIKSEYNKKGLLMFKGIFKRPVSNKPVLDGWRYVIEHMDSSCAKLEYFADGKTKHTYIVFDSETSKPVEARMEVDGITSRVLFMHMKDNELCGRHEIEDHALTSVKFIHGKDLVSFVDSMFKQYPVDSSLDVDKLFMQDFRRLILEQPTEEPPAKRTKQE